MRFNQALEEWDYEHVSGDHMNRFGNAASRYGPTVRRIGQRAAPSLFGSACTAALGRWIGLVAASLSLSGCADLTAVQQFATIGSQVSASEAGIAAWPATYEGAKAHAGTLGRLAQTCGITDPTDYEGSLATAGASAAKNAPLAHQAAQTLALYLQTIGQLAASQTGDTSSERAALNASIAGLSEDKGVKTASQALLSIVDFGVDGWKRRRLARIITRADPSVQMIAAYLAAVTNATVTAYAEVERIDDAYWERSGCSAGDGVRALLLKARDVSDKDAKAARATGVSLSASFTKIAADHALLAKGTNGFEGQTFKAALRRDLPDLVSTLKTIQTEHTS